MRLLRHPLFWIMLLGLAVRLGYIALANHIYYPDEIYATVEQSHRLVFGYGIVPWEFVYGVRSYIAPLMLSAPLWLLRLTNADSPELTALAPKLFLILLSLGLIPAMYATVKSLTRSAGTALAAAFLGAVWYELVYFSPRALTEMMAVYGFALAALLLTSKRWAWGSFALTAAGLLRIQYLPLMLLGVLWIIKKRPPVKPVMVGISIGILTLLAADLWFYGGIATSIINNIRLNTMVGVSDYFGISPWWYYFAAYFDTSGGFVVSVLAGLLLAKTRPLSAAALVLTAFHSLIPHKEYRFLLILIPLYLTITVVLLHELQTRLLPRHRIAFIGVIAVIALFSITAFRQYVPGVNRIYRQPFFARDPASDAFAWLAAQPELCGIYNRSRGFYREPAYINLHRQVQLYNESGPPLEFTYINYFLSDTDKLDIPGFAVVKTFPGMDIYFDGELGRLSGVTVYRREEECLSDPAFSYKRPEPGVEFILKEAGIQPLTKL